MWLKSSLETPTIWRFKIGILGSILLWMGSFLPIFAQNSPQWGTLPSINLNKGLANDWGLNLRWESRQIFESASNGKASDLRWAYDLSDFSLLLTRKVGLNNTLAGGYLLRVRDGRLIHRSIQQFTVVQGFYFFRLAHRFSTDQTFESGEPAEIRLRYRLATEFPLSGIAVDPGEFYIKINHEYLHGFQGKDYDLEIRLVPVLGYSFNDDNKLELGLDYRLDSFLNQKPEHVFWVSLGWFVKL